ncbi:hypothetical protein EVAR_69586_1 [Eumeta japonica]|uniref:Uncharacterized protein n=1 Tax=Eumeta variegata TaxID=151549 RepID=A0A4C1ZY75_EUMVA|nr:hypothetical protein EVAR_69586_1 [Eumeta japonica]
MNEIVLVLSVGVDVEDQVYTYLKCKEPKNEPNTAQKSVVFIPSRPSINRIPSLLNILFPPKRPVTHSSLLCGSERSWVPMVIYSVMNRLPRLPLKYAIKIVSKDLFICGDAHRPRSANRRQAAARRRRAVGRSQRNPGPRGDARRPRCVARQSSE